MTGALKTSPAGPFGRRGRMIASGADRGERNAEAHRGRAVIFRSTRDDGARI